MLIFTKFKSHVKKYVPKLLILFLYSLQKKLTVLISNLIHKIMVIIRNYTKTKYSQKPVWSISEKHGVLSVISEEEVYSINNAPYWGISRLNLNKTFRVPHQWHAVIHNCTVHAPLCAITSDKYLWQQEEVTQLPAISSGYSKYISGKNSKFYFNDFYKKGEALNEAALLAHRTDFNYFHVVFEVLPKIIKLRKMDPLQKMTVLLNAGLNKNINDMLSELIGNRPVIFMEAKKKVTVEKLHVLSVPSYLPDDPVFDITKASLSQKYIKPVQLMLLEYVQCENIQDIELLWVSRRSYTENNKKHGVITRDVENNDEIEALLKAYKATIYYPENHSWKEQADTFRRSKRIVMITGSAVANFIYCQPGTRALLLCKNSGVNPALFFPIFDALNIDYGCVLGDSNSEVPHASFKIAMANLENGLKWLFQENNMPDGYLP